MMMSKYNLNEGGRIKMYCFFYVAGFTIQVKEKMYL